MNSILKKLLVERFRFLFEEAVAVAEASNDTTPPNRLTQLIASGDPAVINAAASNPNLSYADIIKLTGLNPNLEYGGKIFPVEHQFLNTDDNIDLHKALAKNPSIPDWLFKRYIQQMTEEAVNNPILSLKELEDPGFFDDPNLHRSILIKGHNDPVLRDRLMQTYPESAHVLYGGVGGIDKDDLEKFIKFGSPFHKAILNVARSYETHNDNLNRLISHAHDLLKSGNENVANQLLSNLLHNKLSLKTAQSLKNIANDVNGNPTINDENKNAAAWILRREELEKLNPRQLLDVAKDTSNETASAFAANRLKDILSKKDLKSSQFLNAETSDEGKNVLKHLLNFNASPKIAHVLSMHSDPEISALATKLAKKHADDYIERLAPSISSYYDTNSFEKGLKDYVKSQNPALRTYVLTHPTVRAELRRLHTDNAINNPTPLKTKEGEVYYDNDISPFEADDADDNSIYDDDSGAYVSKNTFSNKTEPNIYKKDLTQTAWEHPSTYNYLAQHESPAVRLAITRNENTPAEALHALASDSDAGVRKSVIKHPKTSHKTLNMMKQDRDPEVRELAGQAFDAKFNKKQK